MEEAREVEAIVPEAWGAALELTQVSRGTRGGGKGRVQEVEGAREEEDRLGRELAGAEVNEASLEEILKNLLIVSKEDSLRFIEHKLTTADLTQKGQT